MRIPLSEEKVLLSIYRINERMILFFSFAGDYILQQYVYIYGI